MKNLLTFCKPKENKRMNESLKDPATEPRKGIIPFRITLGITAILAVGFVLTNSPTFALTAVFCFIVAMVGRERDTYPDRRKDAPAVRIILMLMAVAFLFLSPPLRITSSARWQYPLQKRYLSLYQNAENIEWFPDFFHDVKGEYHFDYMASVMQGTGHFSVEFVTTPEVAAAYERIYAEQARYIYPLMSETDSYRLDDKGLEEITVYKSYDFWAGYEDETSNATVYFLSAEKNPNHPHSLAVIIDTDTGRIQFTRLG